MKKQKADGRSATVDCSLYILYAICLFEINRLQLAFLLSWQQYKLKMRKKI